MAAKLPTRASTFELTLVLALTLAFELELELARLEVDFDVWLGVEVKVRETQTQMGAKSLMKPQTCAIKTMRLSPAAAALLATDAAKVSSKSVSLLVVAVVWLWLCLADCCFVRECYFLD